MSNGLPSFDQLLEIARHNPDQLEAIRQQEVEALIARAPVHLQRRLRGLQFQIDCQRSMHKSPMGSCLAISKMMLNSLDELNSALHRARLGGRQRSNTADESAKIIRFPATASYQDASRRDR